MQANGCLNLAGEARARLLVPENVGQYSSYKHPLLVGMSMATIRPLTERAHGPHLQQLLGGHHMHAAEGAQLVQAAVAARSLEGCCQALGCSCVLSTAKGTGRQTSSAALLRGSRDMHVTAAGTTCCSMQSQQHILEHVQQTPSGSDQGQTFNQATWHVIPCDCHRCCLLKSAECAAAVASPVLQLLVQYCS
jgi:hypothetical protein